MDSYWSKFTPPNTILDSFLYSVNCQMFFMNVHRNWMHIDRNTHLLTLSETLLQAYTYSNLTFPDLWRVTNVHKCLEVCLSTFGFNKDRLAVFDELQIQWIVYSMKFFRDNFKGTVPCHRRSFLWPCFCGRKIADNVF